MTNKLKLLSSNLGADDFKKCADIHHNEIQGGLLKLAGKKILFIIYEHIFKSNYSFLIVAKKNEEIIGFFAGCFNQKLFYIDFVKKNFFILILNFLKFLKKDMLIKFFSLNKFFLKKDYNLPEALILNFCVDQKHQSLGVGKILFNEAIDIFKLNNIRNIKITTSKNQEKAINMYNSYGAIKEHQDQNFNKNKNNVVFILKIKNES